jgi:hypothetical protein
MRPATIRRLTVAILTSIASLTVLAGAGAASAGTPTVPFKDANAVGTLTFCNKANEPITHGSIYTQPFAWKTISSSEAPAGYRGTGSRATLVVYQPIKFVDPGDWTGGQLTGASSFSNPMHPNVQATDVDSPLTGFVHAYPLHWDGLVEVRMIFSAVEQGSYTTTYPAAILRVTGHTWRLVEGGGTPCSAGRGVSNEAETFPQSILTGKKSHSGANAAHPHGKGSASNVSRAGSTSSPQSGSASSSDPATDPASVQAKDAASDSRSTSGTSSELKLAIALGVILILVLAISGWRLARRPR